MLRYSYRRFLLLLAGKFSGLFQAILPPLVAGARQPQRASRLMLEEFEPRFCPADLATPFMSRPVPSNGPSGFKPQQISTAYRFDKVNFNGIVGDGSGQTIAIPVAYGTANIVSDTSVFSKQFNLPNLTSLVRIDQSGGTNFPKDDINWTIFNTAMVEWVHAMAPNAKIVLIEAFDNQFTNLVKAVDLARSRPEVSVICIGWFEHYAFGTDPALDAHFTTPAGHQGITFVGTSGDTGNSRPAVSPNVVIVGGTNLILNSDNSIKSEMVYEGSAGGIGGYQPFPAYQANVPHPANSQGRMYPDLVFSESWATPYAVYNTSIPSAWKGWSGVPLMGVPEIAAMVAIANQGRALSGLGTLDGLSQTLPILYKFGATDFRDITQGYDTNRNNAGPGFDVASGNGSPVVDRIVSHLSGFSKVAIQPSVGSSVHGQQVTFTATVSGVSSGIGAPTGSVVFRDGQTKLATVVLKNGVATLSLTTLTTASHTISVDYLGDPIFAARTASIGFGVAQAATATTLSSSVNPSAFGQSVVFTALVAALAPGGGTPTGNVTFKEGNVVFAVLNLSNGLAKYTTAQLSRGRHVITVSYVGDADFLASTSQQLVQIVN